MHTLVVGSSVVDLFLKADADHFKIEAEKVVFSLGDKVPTDIKKLTLGGNGSNVSVGLTRLEIPTTFYTFLGGDILSREIAEGLTREGVDLISDKDPQASSSLSIIFDFKDDRIIFSHHQKREYKFVHPNQNFNYIYLTSVGEIWEKAYEEVLKSSKQLNIPLAFSPGSHQLEEVGELVLETVKSSKIYLSNKEEAEKILGKTGDVKSLLVGIKEMGPEIVSITDGENGGYSIDKEGNCLKITAPSVEATEKTGAGDAYATGFFAGVLMNKPMEDCMRWGAVNAHSVMTDIGAQNGLLTRAKLDTELTKNHNLTVEKI